MLSKNYYRISRILFYTSISFICVSLLSFLWTLITSSRMYFDPSSTGLKEFISYYQPQIALAGVGIALFALWITSERMKQTKEQIDVMSDNNKFNNFYKHREEFIKYLSSQAFIVNLANYSKQNLNDLLLEYHGYFFTRRYDEFEPKIRLSIKNRMKSFFNSISETKELNYNIEKIIDSDISLQISDKWPEFYVETRRAFDNCIETDEEIQSWLTNHIPKKYPIMELCNIYYIYRINLSILAFAGEKYTDYNFPTFPGLFTAYLDNAGLSKLRLD